MCSTCGASTASQRSKGLTLQLQPHSAGFEPPVVPHGAVVLPVQVLGLEVVDPQHAVLPAVPVDVALLSAEHRSSSSRKRLIELHLSALEKRCWPASWSSVFPSTVHQISQEELMKGKEPRHNRLTSELLVKCSRRPVLLNWTLQKYRPSKELSITWIWRRPPFCSRSGQSSTASDCSGTLMLWVATATAGSQALERTARSGGRTRRRKDMRLQNDELLRRQGHVN
ncbi:hypothetical protein EYF80_060041 [Liparis tanakae]|uniref:Uncharacterized protein n=1 Tax=Liparis tanakae TaxID=230148 RepID=A0A4Z2EM00_9TELE|nr:hypothetical protein EYF80_060041 [Liparis tanakae]